MRPGFGAGPFGQPGHRLAQSRCFQGTGEGLDLGGQIARDALRSWPQLLIATAVLRALVTLTLPAQLAVREPLMPGEPDYDATARIIASGTRADDGIAFAGNVRSIRRAMKYEMRADRSRPVDILQAKSPAEVGDFGAWECRRTLPCIGTVNGSGW